MEWKIYFPLGGKAQVDKLCAFLEERLNRAYGFSRRGGEVVIDRGLRDRDEGWRVALFVKHNAGMWVRFVVEGQDEHGNIVYLSTCPKCRDKNVNTPHYQHV